MTRMMTIMMMTVMMTIMMGMMMKMVMSTIIIMFSIFLSNQVGSRLRSFGKQYFLIIRMTLSILIMIIS